jgi:hypothetical protein
MQERLDAFLTRHDHSEAAHRVVAAERAEIDLFERFASYVSYGFYLGRRTAD